MAEAVPAPPPPSLVTLSTDLVVSLLQFLGAQDTARTCRVSRAFHRLVQAHDEVLFRPHVLSQRLISLPTPLTPEQNLAAAHTLQQALAPPGGWKGLYHVAKHLLGVPCLGYFRRVPRDFASDYRGQLIRIRPAFEQKSDEYDAESDLCPTAGLGLSLEVLTSNGKCARIGHVCLCETRGTEGRLVLKAQCKGAHEEDLKVEWQTCQTGEDGQRPCFNLNFQTVGMMDGETFFYERSFHALLSEPPSLLLPEEDRGVLEGLRGFWVGTYGSHGQEIIQVRFTTAATATTSTSSSSAVPATGAAATAATTAPATPILMEGLKIVGDANVPANEWSFRVDVSHVPLDKARVLGADTRPVYTLGSQLQPVPRVLSQEAGRILSMYRGKGQINMVPETWAPQEVGVDVMVLRPEENEGKGGLWVVWHDMEYTSRHCIDLTRWVEKEGKEEQEEEEEQEDEEVVEGEEEEEDEDGEEEVEDEGG